MLSFSRVAGIDPDAARYQIANDGQETIYYIDEPKDKIRNNHPDDAAVIITGLVDETVEDLRLYNLPTKKLIDFDSDIMAKQIPRDRYGKRIYNEVKDRLAEVENKFYMVEDPKISKIQLIPRLIEGQNDRIYVFGPSGVGKSTYCSKYALEWLKYNPGGTVYIFSRKEYDPVFDDVIPGLVRVILDRNFVRDHRNTRNEGNAIKKYEESLVIFDDFLKIEDKTILAAAFQLKNDIFELGRQYNIDVISVQHKGLGGVRSMVEISESTTIVCFPKLNLGESISLFGKKLHLSKDQLERIFDEKGSKQRWLAVIKPNIIITEEYIKIID